MDSGDTRLIQLSLPPSEDVKSCIFKRCLSSVDGVVVENPGVKLRPGDVLIKVRKDVDLSVLSAYFSRDPDVSSKSKDDTSACVYGAKGIEKTHPCSSNRDFTSAAGSKDCAGVSLSQGDDNGCSSGERHPVLHAKDAKDAPTSVASSGKSAAKPSTMSYPEDAVRFIPALEAELAKLKRLKPLPNDIFHLLTRSKASLFFCYGIIFGSMLYGLVF